MVKLKSYRLKDKMKLKQKKKPIKDIVTGGVTALIGIALIDQTAGVIAKL